MIEILFNKADSSVTNLETLTSGMVNTVYVHFSLSSDWQGLSKVAVFSNGIRTIDMLEENWDTQDTCRIPHEVLELPWQTVRVGLQGMNGGDIVLPAVMCCLGRVKPGTEPGNDPGTDPTLPVWAQLQQRVTHLEDAMENDCYTDITKLATGAAVPDPTVRIRLTGVTSLDGCPELRVYQCVRRRDKATYWRHPANWNTNASEGVSKLGYGLIANTEYACGQDDRERIYPSIPEWMPNNGYLQTVFPIDTEVLHRGYIDIPLSTWLLPLLKPIAATQDWTSLGFVSTQNYSNRAPILFQFRVIKNGKQAGNCRQTLCIGFRRRLVNPQYFTAPGRLNTGLLYTSIRP